MDFKYEHFFIVGLRRHDPESSITLPAKKKKKK